MKGKDKCEFLKGIRKRTAEANGIPYETRECTYEGDCSGTCPLCEKEAAELMAELRKKEAEGGEIKTDDASILAIELLQHCERNDFHDANKEEKDMEGKLLQGSLVNSSQDITEFQFPPIPSLDPFRGSTNPIMSEKQLDDMRHQLKEYKEPLMGDIREPFVEPTEEEKITRLQLEESLREEDEIGKVSPGSKRKIQEYLAKFKGIATQGLIEEE